MKLLKFKVMNYRNITDSGWIKFDDIAVIVGKNESGKTSLLKALWKFNPFKKEEYDLDREWPRGRRKERSGEKIVVKVVFKFDSDEKQKISQIHESAKDVNSVELSRDYNGSYYYSFIPNNPANQHDLKWVISVIKNHIGELPKGFSQNFISKYPNTLEVFINEVRDNGGSQYFIENIESFRNELQKIVSPNQGEIQNDNQKIQVLNQMINQAISELKINPPLQQVIDTVHEWLPTFIYMDDYRIFKGSSQLNQIKQRKDNNLLTEEDKTIIMIMEMSGLNLDDEVQKGNSGDKEQRMLDMNDASQTLTNEIADRWSQKKYEVMFQADGQHFITFVKDIDSKILVPLEERSKGFQWFFSFDMTFMYETRGQFENTIILLDEPGLHLHAAAQKDLLERMKEYSKNNQLIYTTHLPFMINLERLDNIYIAEEKGAEGTKVHKDWLDANEDARFTLQSALGLSWSQSLFVGKNNLIVEGVTDFWYLMTMSTLFHDQEKEGLNEDLVITPAGGATKVAYLGTLLKGQELNVMVLLDSDSEGQKAYEQLVHQWILDKNHVLMLGTILGKEHQCAIEDLFSEEFYLEHVYTAYKRELNGNKLNLNNIPNLSIVTRIENALQELGIEKFNKGRVAKKIMNELSKRSTDDFDEETIRNFETLFSSINRTVNKWTGKTVLV